MNRRNTNRTLYVNINQIKSIHRNNVNVGKRDFMLFREMRNITKIFY